MFITSPKKVLENEEQLKNYSSLSDVIKRLNLTFYQSIFPKLNKKSIKLLKKYTGTECYDYTCHLLEKSSDMNVKKRDDIKNILSYFEFNCHDEIDPKQFYKCKVKKLDKIIKRSHIPISLTVYRGTSYEYFQKTSLVKGNKFTNLIYYSTSIDLHTVTTFRSTMNSSDRELIIEFQLPRNYNALWINPVSCHPKELEILLNRNLTFEILSQETREYRNRELIYMKVRPSHDKIKNIKY